MNKRFFILAAVPLALAVAACDDHDNDDRNPPTNETQPPRDSGDEPHEQ